MQFTSTRYNDKINYAKFRKQKKNKSVMDIDFDQSNPRRILKNQRQNIHENPHNSISEQKLSEKNFDKDNLDYINNLLHDQQLQTKSKKKDQSVKMLQEYSLDPNKSRKQMLNENKIIQNNNQEKLFDQFFKNNQQKFQNQQQIPQKVDVKENYQNISIKTTKINNQFDQFYISNQSQLKKNASNLILQKQEEIDLKPDHQNLLSYIDTDYTTEPNQKNSKNICFLKSIDDALDYFDKSQQDSQQLNISRNSIKTSKKNALNQQQEYQQLIKKIKKYEAKYKEIGFVN